MVPTGAEAADLPDWFSSYSLFAFLVLILTLISQRSLMPEMLILSLLI